MSYCVIFHLNDMIYSPPLAEEWIAFGGGYKSNIELFSVCPFVLFMLAIVFSVLLRYTDSDYPFVCTNSSYVEEYTMPVNVE